MKRSNCPVCFGALERITCAPCYDCGHSPIELEHFRDKEHEYHIFKIFGQDIVLCDFCDADFASYYPDYFGLPGEFPIQYPLKLVRKIDEPRLEPDSWCKDCKHRLAFLRFLYEARSYNQARS